MSIPATDSTRYFVLRLTDGQGRHALIGLGFNDRNEAFDFKVSVQDARKQKSEDWSLKNAGPAKDYSLPEGAKIHVNLATKKGKDGAARRESTGSSSQSLTAAVSSLKIGDDGTEKKKRKKKKNSVTSDEGQPSSAAAAAPTNRQADLFGFGTPAPAPAAAASSSASSTSAFDAPADTPSDWVTF
jgi:hypothetical protein